MLTTNALSGFGSGGGGGAGFAVGAVTLADVIYERDAQLTGIANGFVGLISFWFRVDTDAASNNTSILNTVGGGFSCSIRTSDKFRVHINTVAYGDLDHDTSGTYTASSTWHHLISSWNTNASAGNKVCQIYVDDADVSVKVNDSNAASPVPYLDDPSDWQVGRGWYGGISELYFNTIQYYDLDTEDNRRKFIDADGKPVDLASDGSNPTGSAPMLYMRVQDGGAVGDFATNQGGGGGMTKKTGTPALSSDSPSD